MAQVAAIGSGPVEFTSSDGTQQSIPLIAIYFDNGQAKTDNTRWPPYTKYKAEVDPWLAYLAKSGELTAGKAPAPASAMVITAADPGQAGNNITVTFSNITPDPANPNDSTKTTFDALVVETDTYATLSFDSTSPNFVKKILGTETSGKSGLVHALDADTPTQPKPGNYQLSGGGAATKSSAPINGDPTGVAFHLEAKKVSSDGDKTKVTISNVDATGKTFSLVAAWSSQPITGIKLGDLPGKLSGYEISVSLPSSGNYAIPVAGSISLAGGSGTMAASAASAAVPAG